MSKPVEEEKEPIPEEKAIQMYRERDEIIHGYNKSEQFKEMFEEIFIMVISQDEGGKKSEEVTKAEQKAFFMSGIIKCKANDFISDKHGFTEMQLETAVVKHDLKGSMGREDAPKKEEELKKE